jgi:hypothetical protein
MGADGYAEALLAVGLEGSVGEVGEGEVCGGVVGGGEPAFVSGDGSPGHGGMIAVI